MAKMRALMEGSGADTTEQFMISEGAETTENTAPLIKYGTRTSFAETVDITVGGDN